MNFRRVVGFGNRGGRLWMFRDIRAAPKKH
jgi:hypothetical protein